MKLEMTVHARVDRIERLVTIVEHIGMGEIEATAPNPKNPGTSLVLTSTGVMLVRDDSCNRLITGWVAKTGQVINFYNSIGITKAPQRAVKRAKENRQKYGFLYEL